MATTCHRLSGPAHCYAGALRREFIAFCKNTCRATSSNAFLNGALCRVAGLDVEVCKVFLSKGEHKTPQYLEKLNPLGKVPALQVSSTVASARSSCSAGYCFLRVILALALPLHSYLQR